MLVVSGGAWSRPITMNVSPPSRTRPARLLASRLFASRLLASPALLREVARKGYAVSSGKDVPGVKSVAAPVFDGKGACLFALAGMAGQSVFGLLRLD